MLNRQVDFAYLCISLLFCLYLLGFFHYCILFNFYYIYHFSLYYYCKHFFFMVYILVYCSEVCIQGCRLEKGHIVPVLCSHS